LGLRTPRDERGPHAGGLARAGDHRWRVRAAARFHPASAGF